MGRCGDCHGVIDRCFLKQACEIGVNRDRNLLSRLSGSAPDFACPDRILGKRKNIAFAEAGEHGQGHCHPQLVRHFREYGSTFILGPGSIGVGGIA